MQPRPYSRGVLYSGALLAGNNGKLTVKRQIQLANRDVWTEFDGSWGRLSFGGKPISCVFSAFRIRTKVRRQRCWWQDVVSSGESLSIQIYEEQQEQFLGDNILLVIYRTLATSTSVTPVNKLVVWTAVKRLTTSESLDAFGVRCRQPPVRLQSWEVHGRAEYYPVW